MKKIFIKPENRGKFTATKERTGKSTEELTHSSNPVTKKRAVFAQNAAKWHHKVDGGPIMKKKFQSQKKAVGGTVEPIKKNLDDSAYAEALAKAPKYVDLVDKYGSFSNEPIKRKAIQEAWDREHPRAKERRSQLPERSFVDGGTVLDYQQLQQKDNVGDIAGIAGGVAQGAVSGGLPGAAIALAAGIGKKLIGDKALAEKNALIEKRNTQGALQSATAGLTGSIKGDNSALESQYASQAGNIDSKASAIQEAIDVTGKAGIKLISDAKDAVTKLAVKAKNGGYIPKMAKGGKVKGAGTGTSDSIPAKLDGGDFIVPANNAEKAMALRKDHFGESKQVASTNDGEVPVSISNGEVRFTKDEMDYLDEIGEGSKIRDLAPNAKQGNKKAGGGGVLTSKKDIAVEQIKRDNLTKDRVKYMAIKDSKMPISSPSSIPDTPQLILSPKQSSDFETYRASKVGKYTPPKNKLADFAKKNAGSLAFLGQAGVGLAQSIKNAAEERNRKNVESSAATMASDQANKLEQSATQAAQTIMSGTESDADRAAGNYMKVARETGGSSSANVLAGAAKVGQSSSENYLKGMTAAAQLKLSGQQAASELRMKGSTQADAMASYNDEQRMKILAEKSANSNELIKAGLTNAVMAKIEKDKNKALAIAKEKSKTVTNTTTGQFKYGGVVKKLKK